jgi:hypothetical protein
MYILKIEAINHFNDIFFGDTVHYNSEKADESLFKSVSLNPSVFVNEQLFTRSERITDLDHWKQINYFYYFNSVASTEKFALHINTDTSEYRLLIRSWNQSNNILLKFYVTDIDGNIVKVLTDCEQQTCLRFGGKCSTETGCSTQEYAASLKYKTIIPIASR